MNKYRFFHFYLTFLCVTLVWNTMNFFGDNQISWAVAGGVFLIPFIISTIGSYKNIKSLLWLGIVCLSLYSLYAVGAIIRGLFVQEATLFLVFFVIIFCLINIYSIKQIKERINSIKPKLYGNPS